MRDAWRCFSVAWRTTHKLTHAHKHTYIHIHTYIRIHVHTDTQKHVHTQPQTFIHTSTCTQILTTDLQICVSGGRVANVKHSIDTELSSPPYKIMVPLQGHGTIGLKDSVQARSSDPQVCRVCVRVLTRSTPRSCGDLSPRFDRLVARANVDFELYHQRAR